MVEFFFFDFLWKDVPDNGRFAKWNWPRVILGFNNSISSQWYLHLTSMLPYVEWKQRSDTCSWLCVTGQAVWVLLIRLLFTGWSKGELLHFLKGDFACLVTLESLTLSLFTILSFMGSKLWALQLLVALACPPNMYTRAHLFNCLETKTQILSGYIAMV